MGEENHIDMKEEVVGEIPPSDPFKKKKKKKKVLIQETSDESVHKLAENTESLSVSDGLASTSAGKKNKCVYEYEEILGRFFNILREKNPELVGYRRRTVIRTPQVLREGSKKTVFVNFMDLCKTYLHGQADHVMNFLLVELGTTGSLDGQQRLVVKGIFSEDKFETIIRRYMNDYVICLGCKSPDTILSKENRLFFLRCETCGSGRSVAPIKAGYVARVGRRKA